MAIDEALLNSFNPETSTPVLRLYGWNPPAFSLGRFQDAATVLCLDRCREMQIPVVRRVTGGGAIYHAEELTYSIVCSPHHLPPVATIKESFRVLTGFLLAFYRSLGISACYAADSAPAGVILGMRTPFCFAGRESYDIVIDGKKIGGNAQRRLKSVIFQHGSIPMRDTLAAALGFLLERPMEIDDSVVHLAGVGVTDSPEDLKSRIAAAFADCLGTSLDPAGLTARERELAEALSIGKYAGDAWNVRGEEL